MKRLIQLQQRLATVIDHREARQRFTGDHGPVLSREVINLHVIFHPHLAELQCRRIRTECVVSLVRDLLLIV